MLVSVNLVPVNSFGFLKVGLVCRCMSLNLKNTNFRSYAQINLDYIYIRFVGESTIKQPRFKPVKQVYIHQTAGTLRFKTDVQRFLR